VVLAVADGSADLGVVAGQTPRRCLIGVPLGHPLVRRKSVRFADALDYSFVGPHADSSLATLMAQGARACKTSPPIVKGCFFTMVAVDDERKPVPVAPLRPSTPDEHRRHAAAIARRDMRRQLQ
jgi:hypothetical protein